MLKIEAPPRINLRNRIRLGNLGDGSYGVLSVFLTLLIFHIHAESRTLTPVSSLAGASFSSVLVEIKGKPHLVAGIGSSLVLFDISNPEEPSETGRVYLGNAASGDLAVSGSLAFVLVRAVELKIFDISNPAKPALLSEFPVKGGGKLLVQGDRVFLSNHGIPLEMLDISDP